MTFFRFWQGLQGAKPRNEVSFIHEINYKWQTGTCYYVSQIVLFVILYARIVHCIWLSVFVRVLLILYRFWFLLVELHGWMTYVVFPYSCQFFCLFDAHLGPTRLKVWCCCQELNTNSNRSYIYHCSDIPKLWRHIHCTNAKLWPFY